MAEESQLFPSEESIAYFVKTEAFEGPLDLLLHLIKKNELDIYNIPMAEISRQYLDYIDVMRELNLDVAGEFLVMASTLIQIKSQMLLPSISLDEGEEETVEDPRAELVRRLLEYEKYRGAAKELYSRNLLQRDVFKRDFFPSDTEVTETSEPIEVEIFELVNAFKKILSKIPEESFHEVGSENISISDRISDILEYLTGKEYLEFEELFLGNLTREFVVATFLAILELCRLKLIRLTQIETYGTIWVKPTVLPVDPDSVMEDSIDTYRA